MTYDLKIILKYSMEVLLEPRLAVLAWLEASVGGIAPLLWPLRAVLAGLGRPGAAKTGQAKKTAESGNSS